MNSPGSGVLVMRILLRSLLILALIVCPFEDSRAGLDLSEPSTKGSNVELIVLEAPGCIYCTIFRRDVLPSYQASERARSVPVRFFDVNDSALEQLGLDGPINIVPTFVVLKNNKEIGRIPGYVGPENFYHTINYLLSTVP